MVIMQYLLIGIVSLLSGLTASLGLGGGFILVIYLTAFVNMSQIQAQGVNLLFFIPIAVLSLIGFILGNRLGSEWLSKLFAMFILIVGLKELFHRKKAANKTGGIHLKQIK